MADSPMAPAPVDCKKAQLLINAYLDGELDLSASLELEAHLADCAACRARREELAKLSGRLRTGLTRHAAPAGLRAGLAQLAATGAPLTQEGVSLEQAARRSSIRRWQRRQFMALAASVLLAVFASGGTTYLLSVRRRRIRWPRRLWRAIFGPSWRTI
jgi:anti-sigma factor RsiW